METENQEIYRTNSKLNGKQQLNSFHIFEPDYFINSAFTLTDSEQRFSSKFLDQPFFLTPLQPSHNIIDQSKFNLKQKPLQSKDAFNSSIKIIKTALPSIENIVIQYQHQEEEQKKLKITNNHRVQDIFNNRPQFQSLEIKTQHFTKELGLQLKKPESLHSESFQQLSCESMQNPIEKKDMKSLNYIYPYLSAPKIIEKAPVFKRFTKITEIRDKVQQSKKASKKLQNICQFLKEFAKNRRDFYAKETKRAIDWNIVKFMIEKQLKSSANS